MTSAMGGPEPLKLPGSPYRFQVVKVVVELTV